MTAIGVFTARTVPIDSAERTARLLSRCGCGIVRSEHRHERSADAPARAVPTARMASLRVQDSESDRIARAYREHWSMLCRFVARRFGDGPPEPEEVAQAAFARFSSLPSREEIQNVPAFLVRCASNIVLDARRQRDVRARHASLTAAMAQDSPEQTIAIDRELEARQRLAAINDAIMAMEERRRTVLLLHSFHELTAAEIARRMNLSRTRVVQLLADAVAICTRAARIYDGEEE